MSKKIIAMAAAAALALPLVWAGDQLVEAITADTQELPYLDDFDSQEDFDKNWTVIDANNDGYTYSWLSYGGYEYRHGSLYLFSNQSSETCADYMDDWAISPAFDLKADRDYRISFLFRGTIALKTLLKLYVGQAPTVEGMTQQVYEYDADDTKHVREVEFEFHVPADGIYYIGFHETSFTGPWKYTFNYSSHVGHFQVEEAASRLVPEQVADLTQVPGANGAQTMGLKWINPSETRSGAKLSALQKVCIYKDGSKTPVELTDKVTPGAACTWNDPSVTAGSHTYRLTTVNEAGESYGSEVSTFVGKDVPGAPKNLSIAVNGTVPTLTWSAADFGKFGGWYDQSSVKYRVVRQPGNTLLASDLTVCTYTDETISSLSNYYYEVTALNADGTGLTAQTPYTQIGKTASFPLLQDFEDDGFNDLWTIIDGNADGECWAVVRDDRGNNEPKALVSDLWNVKSNGDNWYISPAVKIEKGETYRVTICGNTNIYTSETIDLYYGKDKTPAALTKFAYEFADMSTSASYAQFSGEFTAESSYSVGYFGFYASAFSSRFYMDDIKIEHVTSNDIELTSVKNSTTVTTIGQEVSTLVTYTNRGNAQCKSFTIQLCDMNGNVLASKKVARPLNAGVQSNATLTWTPTEVGKMGYYAKAVFSESNPDTQPDNNVSRVQYLDVLPKQETAVVTGTEETLIWRYPFRYEGKKFNETVYPASYLQGVTGTIDSLAYKAHFGHEYDYHNIHFQIYVGETTQYDMSAGWIPSTELQLVFDGGLDFVYGIQDLVIPFQNPFDYHGGNLCVLVYSDIDYFALSDGYGMRFYATNVSSSVVRYLPEDGTTEAFYGMDPANPNQAVGNYSDYLPNTIFYMNTASKGAVSGVVTTNGKALEKAVVRVKGTNAYAQTDASGAYSLPYVEAGRQVLTVSKSGYETDSAEVMVTAQGSLTQNFDIKVKPQVAFKGHVVGSNDLNTPLADAKVALSMYDDYSAYTDANGDFSIDKVWGNATYLLTVDCVGYQQYADTIQVKDVAYDCQTIVLKQEAAQPATITATDGGTVADITWTAPINSHWLQKDQTDCVGSFGGSYEYAVAHRYLPSELENAGIVDGLYVTKVRFYASASATFVLKIWQGQTDAESEVYSQDVNITKFEDWTEITLDTPYKIDPTKNLLIGFHVSQSSGARPVGFDYGPLMAGGDVVFDDDSNAWTSAHELVSTMAYNWLIRAYCNVDANSRTLELAPDYGENAVAAGLRNISIKNPASDRKDRDIIAGATEGYSMKLNADRQSNVEALRAARRGAKANDVPDSTKPVGYNVWRLVNGDEQNEANWTLVTPEPVQGFSCQDATFGAQEDKVYRYAIRSVFVNDVESEPTFSNGVDKGKYATVTGHVTAETNTPAGAIASLENSTGYYEAVVDADGNVHFDNVYFGTYTYTLKKGYFETLEQKVTIRDVKEFTLPESEIKVDARKPKVFTATDYVDNVQMTWAAPSNTQGQWVHKDGTPYTGGIGYNGGGEIICGQRFTSAELEQFSHGDFYVTNIAIHTFMEGEYTIKVWSGNEKNEFEIYSQKTYVETNGEWSIVKLDEPLKLDPYMSYVFGYEVVHESGYYPCGYDEGPEVEGGDVMYYNNAWYTFYQASAAQYSVNWSIRTFISDDPNEIVDPETVEEAETNSNRLIVSRHNTSARTAEDEAMPITYKIWRTTEAAKTHSGQWTPVTPEAISETQYTDTTWPDVVNGNYYYVIKAIYNGSIESQPVYSSLLEKGNTSMVKVTVNTNNDESSDGAFVTLSNEANTYRGNVRDGKLTLTGVYLGTYDLSIELDGYNTYTASVEVSDQITELSATLQEILYAPVGVKAKINEENNVVVTWKAPNTYVPTPGWFYWDDGTVYAAFSMNGSFFGVGHVYNVEDQKSLGMKGLYITEISFPVLDYAAADSSKYAPTDGTYTLKIWKGTSLDEVYSQTVTSYEKNRWNTYKLDTPFYVDGTDYVMFGYEYTGTGYPAAIDNGPAIANKGDIGATSQGSWTPLAQAGYDYNFVLHVYGEDPEDMENVPEGAPRRGFVFDGSEEAQEASAMPEMNGHLDVTLGEFKAIEAPAQASAQSRPQAPAASNITYKVYRHSSKEYVERRWKLLTATPISEMTYTDETWSTLTSGSYIYSVKAVYASGESDAVNSAALSPSDISSVEVGALKVSATTKQLGIQSPEAGEAYLYDNAGALQFHALVKAGANSFKTTLLPGVYTLKIGENVLKVSVK